MEHISQPVSRVIADIDATGKPRGMTEWEFRQLVKDMIALYGNQARAVMETTIQQELDKDNGFHA